MLNALIWDLDGTLIDSYPAIVQALFRLSDRMGCPRPWADIEAAVKGGSVHGYLTALAQESGRPIDELRAGYNALLPDGPPELLPGAAETLALLAGRGVDHYIYTHKGPSTLPLLEELGIAPFFREVVTAQAGFPRKPAPDAPLYLMDRHHLSPSETGYVGDRDLDALCARRAGITSILLAGPHLTCSPDHLVSALPEVAALCR